MRAFLLGLACPTAATEREILSGVTPCSETHALSRAGGLLWADDKDGNSVQLFTSKVLPVPATSRDTNELRGNLSGIANPAKYEKARAELRPYALLVVDWLETEAGEEQQARVKPIDKAVFGEQLPAVMELIKAQIGRSVTSPLGMLLLFPEYFNISQSEALNLKQGEGTLIKLRENRPDTTGLARANLDTLEVPAGERRGETFADQMIVATDEITFRQQKAQQRRQAREAERAAR